MAANMSISRQRVPMVDPSILEDRTRPLEGNGLAAARLRYFQLPTWSADADGTPSHRAVPTQARLGRR